MTTIMHIIEFLACDPAGQVVALGLAGVVAAVRWSPNQTKELRND